MAATPSGKSGPKDQVALQSKSIGAWQHEVSKLCGTLSLSAGMLMASAGTLYRPTFTPGDSKNQTFRHWFPIHTFSFLANRTIGRASGTLSSVCDVWYCGETVRHGSCSPTLVLKWPEIAVHILS